MLLNMQIIITTHINTQMIIIHNKKTSCFHCFINKTTDYLLILAYSRDLWNIDSITIRI